MPTRNDRLEWVDAARGFCVLAVVLLHFTIFAYLGTVENERYAQFWSELDTSLTPIRMPTLFFISGLLLSSSVKSGFSPKTRVAILRNYYLYVVWVLVFAVLASWQSNGVPPVWQGWDLALALVYPQSVLWYILALVLWTVVLAAVRRVPSWIILAALVALSVCVYWMPGVEGVDQYLRILKYGIHFALGVYAKRIALQVGVMRPRMVLLAVGGVGVIVLGATIAANVPSGWEIRLVEIVTEIASIVLLIVASSVLSEVAPILARGFGWFGRRSMPIYVLHAPVILALASLPIWRDLVLLPHLTWLSPLIWTFATAILCVAIWKLLKQGPGSLFAPPDRLRRLVERSPRADRD